VIAAVAVLPLSHPSRLATGLPDCHGQPGSSWTVRVVQTSGNLAQRLARLKDLCFLTTQPAGGPIIHVDDSHRYQSMTGVGAAMTDSSAWLIYDNLSRASRAALMRRLFGASGIHLSFVRVPMGASDFTVQGRPYSYDDVPPGQSDPELRHFSIAHDRAYIIPALRQMRAINPRVQILANPWSPPRWMKTNGSSDDVHFQGNLRLSAYGPLAQYFVKFLQAYRAQGVAVTAVTPENEPRSPAPFPAMHFLEPAEAQWIVRYLAPALRAAQLPTWIYGGDVSWGAYFYPDALVSSPARAALHGIAWHCYSSVPYVMSQLHGLAPMLDQIVSECAQQLVPYPVPEIMIGAIRNWASGVALWNLALDPSGGPVQPPNRGCGGCRGLVTINKRTHSVRYSLAYYQLGQVGRFVQPGAQRVGTEHFVVYYQRANRNYGATPGLDDVAFVNPNGTRVLVAYNNSLASIRFAVEWRGRSFAYSLAPRATVTFVWPPPP